MKNIEINILTKENGYEVLYPNTKAEFVEFDNKLGGVNISSDNIQGALTEVATKCEQLLSGPISASRITNGTLNGEVVAKATSVSNLSKKQVRNIYAGTTDIGTGATLATGDIYLVYEQ